MATMATGEPETADVRIERLASGGEGVGRLADGLTIFVPQSAPGDLVSVYVTERRRRHARGEIARLLESGSARVSPPCPVFGRCGGCAWQHVDYAQQLVSKQTILRDAMQRIGRIRLAELPTIVASPSAYAYRGRTRLLERDGAVGYRERGSHALCALRACPILMPELDRRLGVLADEVAASVQPGEREWELALGRPGDVRATSLASGQAPSPADRIALEVGIDTLELSPGTFAQGNSMLLDTLHQAVCSRVGEGDSLLELFAGAGFFSLALARCFAHVQLVESDAGAVEDLRANLSRAGLMNVVVTPLCAEVAIPDRIERVPDVVLLDPPRAGLDQAVLRCLAALDPDRIVYLSCDPATLARDVARLLPHGFVLRSLEGFDLFPQTPHVEALAVLVREDVA
jgi:23S rRNA (uracil1939-C5)-methyltransferase